MGKGACLHFVCFRYCLLITFTLILIGNPVFFVSWFYGDVCCFSYIFTYLNFTVVFLNFWFHGHIDFPNCLHARLDMRKDFYVYLFCLLFRDHISFDTDQKSVFFSVSWFHVHIC